MNSLPDAALDILAISTGEARLRVIRRPADRRALRQWQGGPRSKFVVRVELSGFGEEPVWLDLDPAEALAFSRSLGDKASEAHEGREA